MVRAFVVIVSTFAYIFLMGTPFLIYAVLTGNTDPIYGVGRLATKFLMWLGGVRLEVHGLDKIPAGRAVVFMPNHQSNVDAPALFSILPAVLILAKKEFFRIPILNRGMVMRGFIPVDRKNREKAIEAVEQAARSLRAGHSFLVFPEGTRSPDGRLQPFKKGAFMMAIKAGVPIIPITVSGGSKIMPKDKLVVTPGLLRITFHDPVSTEGLTLDDRTKVMECVRQAILANLAEDEMPLERKKVKVDG